MARKITVHLGPNGLILHLPLELLTRLLKPRVIYASGTRFTKREAEVLDGVVQGLANKEIANKLNLSERTVKFHLKNLFEKTKTQSRSSLQATYLAENGEKK